VPRQVELRSRPIEAGSAGAPREYGARLQGRPSLGYLSWPRKKGNQPPGCPRPLLNLKYRDRNTSANEKLPDVNRYRTRFNLFAFAVARFRIGVSPFWTIFPVACESLFADTADRWAVLCINLIRRADT